MTESQLDLRLAKWLIKGGESGQAIIPGNSGLSLLVQKVTDKEMPPDGKSISSEELSIIKKWIDLGAKTARPEPDSIDDSLITDEEKSFWSFQVVNTPELPAVQSVKSIENGLDRFILAQLESRNLTFSPPADRRVLIRRLYFDLIGLPPEPGEVEAFLNDRSANAYTSLIDRLLASPRYGERWGRHWLDVAGYADSEGFTDKDPEREFAFFYRDYVIDIFNQGIAYDQFVIEQLAGDELIQGPLLPLSAGKKRLLKATGFLRMAADGTASSGADRDLATNENIADTIQIVSTALTGLTVGCARCHNHRYDPIRQEDYYRLRAIFEPALDWKKWRTPKQRQISLYSDHDKKQRAEIELKAKAVDDHRIERQKAHIQRTLFEELLVAPDKKRDALQEAFQTSSDNRTATQKALLEEYPNIQNISNGSLYLYAEQRSRRAKKIESKADTMEQAYLNEVASEHLKKIEPSRLSEVMAALEQTPAKRNAKQKELETEFPGVFVTPTTLSIYNAQGAKEITKYREAAAECRKQNAKDELANLTKKAAEIRSAAPREYFVRALTEPSNHAPTTFLFKRGNHQSPAQEVPPGDLQILSDVSEINIPSNDQSIPTTGRRMAYAKQLTTGKHPLLARVFVNRVWAHHFGIGLVDTPGDFGMLGSRPSHPKLLDWLATEFVESGWNIKGLHRMILTSRTFQQTSARTDSLDQIDPANRLLARMSLRRLESEVIRDSVLQVSGQLVNRLGGSPVPVKEDGVGQIVLGKQKLDGERKPQSGNNLGADAERRSVYIQVRRSRPLGILESFDIATNAPNCNRRIASNVAPQSLMLMNSEFMVGYSKKLASRIEQETSDRRLQFQLATRLCYGRTAQKEMLEWLSGLADTQSRRFRESNPKWTEQKIQTETLANICHALMSANEFIYVD